MTMNVRPSALPGVSSYPLDDELVLYTPNDGQAYVLNHTAARIWRLLDGTRTEIAVARELADTYGEDYDDVLEDVRELVEHLRPSGCSRPSRTAPEPRGDRPGHGRLARHRDPRATGAGDRPAGRRRGAPRALPDAARPGRLPEAPRSPRLRASRSSRWAASGWHGRRPHGGARRHAGDASTLAPAAWRRWNGRSPASPSRCWARGTCCSTRRSSRATATAILLPGRLGQRQEHAGGGLGRPTASRSAATRSPCSTR